MIEGDTREEARRDVTAKFFGLAAEACLRHAALRRSMITMELEIWRFLPKALDAHPWALVDSLCNIQIDLSSALGLSPAFDIAGLRQGRSDHKASNEWRLQSSKTATVSEETWLALQSARTRIIRTEKDFTRAFKAWSDHEEELKARIARLEIDNAKLRGAIDALTAGRNDLGGASAQCASEEADRSS